MDPLKSTPLPPQEGLSLNSTKKPESQDFLVGVGAADDCGLDILALFGEAETITQQVGQQTENLKAGILNLEEGSIVEQKGIENDVINSQHAEVGKVLQDTGHVQATSAALEVLQRKDAIKNVGFGKFTEAGIEFIPAHNMSMDGLNNAFAKKELMMPVGDHIVMHAEYAAMKGLQVGQKIQFRDEQGAVRELTIRHFTESEANVLSNVLSTYIAQMPSKSRDNVKEEKLDKHGEEKPLHNHHNREIKVLVKDARREKDERVKADIAKSFTVGSKKDELKMTERANEEMARKREHDARLIDKIKTKEFVVISDDTKKHDVSNQSHLLDVLKQDHDVRQIPRSLLDKAKGG